MQDKPPFSFTWELFRLHAPLWSLIWSPDVKQVNSSVYFPAKMIDRAADEHTNGVCWQMLSVERILTLNDTLADGSSATCVKARLKKCISSNVGTSTSITLQLHLTLNWQVMHIIALSLPIKKRLVDFQVLFFHFSHRIAILLAWDSTGL